MVTPSRLHPGALVVQERTANMQSDEEIFDGLGSLSIAGGVRRLMGTFPAECPDWMIADEETAATADEGRQVDKTTERS